MEVALGRRDRDRKEAVIEMLSLSFDEGAGEKRPLAPKMPACPATAARQGVTEVSAAQPYTRSKTPRYGSTARSGSRLFESKRS